MSGKVGPGNKRSIETQTSVYWLKVDYKMERFLRNYQPPPKKTKTDIEKAQKRQEYEKESRHRDYLSIPPTIPKHYLVFDILFSNLQ